MLESLKLNAKTTQGGCGIYEAGDPYKTHMDLFVTNGGRIIALTGRVLDSQDLMNAYNWGHTEALEAREDYYNYDEPEEAI